jgi:HD domain-containing protein
VVSLQYVRAIVYIFGMSGVGTWEWAQETGGSLRHRDRLRLIGQGVLARLTRMPSDWRDRLLGEHASLTLPEPPDSALAREADECVRELSRPALYGHCARTWTFAALFAQRDRVEHDRELLYLACMLHDLGLTERHWGSDPQSGCFAVEGARAAHAFVHTRGGGQERARTVAEAISLHLNVTVPVRLGAEAHLLSKGVSLDVVGRRLHQIPPATVVAVDGRYPRDACSAELARSVTKQAQLRPTSRAALLRRLGFVALIERNPLEDRQRRQAAMTYATEGGETRGWRN